MKSFVRLTAVGLSGLVAFKLLTTLLLPLLGMFIGLIMLTVKLALAAAVIYFVYSMFRPREDEKRPEDEIVVEVEVEEVEEVEIADDE